MFVSNQLIGFGGGGVSIYAAPTVKFDGANDYLTRGAGLTGASDADAGIFSVWVDFNGTDSNWQYFVTNDGEYFIIRRNTSNYVEVSMYNSVRGSTIFSCTSTVTVTASSGWVHILISWDLSASAAHLYLNDVDRYSAGTLTAGTLDYTWSECTIGARAGGSNPLDADVADLYLNFGEYLDFSTESNRRKFIDASGKPVDLGSDGSTPTGTAPIIFLSGETASWHTNKGGGGGMTETGALTDGSSSPSD